MPECKSCGDGIFPDQKCEVKKCKVPRDQRCFECHVELEHGAVPNVTGDGRLGGNPRGGGLDPSPWQENNVRLMEGDTRGGE